MRVRDLRVRLEELAKGAEDTKAIKALVTALALHDDMELDSLLRRLSRRTKPAAPKPIAADIVDEAVEKLRAVFRNESAFEAELNRVAKDRLATRSVLEQVFYKLFDRTRGVPKKATRVELLRLIENERTIIVRDERMGDVLGRRIVPAE